jgi:hypothetical protein
MNSPHGMAPEVDRQFYLHEMLQGRMAELDVLKGQARDETQWLSHSEIRTHLREEVRKGMFTPIDDPNFAANRELADMMARTEELTRPSNIDSQVLDVYDRVLNWTKAWQLARPGFHARNTFSIVWNNALADVDFKTYGKWFKANSAYSKGEESWTAFKRVEPKIADFYEQSRHLGGGGQFVNEQLVNSERSASLLPTRDFFGLRASRRAGHNVEGMGRGVLAMDVMMKGGSAEDAVAMIDKFHFDYADLSRTETEVVKRIIPFYVWSRRNLPLQMEMLVRHPATFSHYAAFQRNIQMDVPLVANPGDVIPQYYGDKSTYPTPFTEQGKTVYAMPDLPFEDINRFTQGNPLSEVQSMVTPIIKAPIELWANKQSFKGIPLTGRQVQMPRAHMPFLPILALMPGVIKKDKKTGGLTVREDIAYTIDQFLPMIANARRHPGVANEDRYKDRELTQLLNFYLGVGLRTATKNEQNSERLRQQFAK